MEFQSIFHHQLLLLATNLFYQAAPYRTDTTDKEVQYLIFGEEERVVDYVQWFTQGFGIDNKRDISFRSSLCASDNIDTITSQCTEKFTCNTRCMFHILTYDSHCCQISFRQNRRNLTHLYFFRKLFVQHFTSQVGIGITHTDRSTVFRWSLWHEEHADSILCQCFKDAVVDTDHTYHTEALNSNQTCVVDGGNTLDSLALRVGNFLFDNRSHSIRVECILYYNRNILVTYGIDSRRINHLCTEVTKFGRFYITQFRNGISSWNDTRVSRHKSVYIGPDFQTCRIQSRSNNGSRIVRATTSEVRYIPCCFIRRDESRHQCYFRNRLESLFH